MTGVSVGPSVAGEPALDKDGKPIILQANYTNPDEAPVDSEQQEKLNDFANVHGGTPIPPSPARPDDLTTTTSGTSPEEQISLYQADLRLQQRDLEYQKEQIGNPGHPNSHAAQQLRDIDQRLEDITVRQNVLNSLKQFDTRVGQAPEILHFDPSGDDKIDVGYGDVENATHIAVMIPGTGTDLNDFSTEGGTINDRIIDIMEQLEFEAGANGAVIGYLGYDAPDNLLQAASASYGQEGAAALHSFLDGLPEKAEVHLFPHSYANVLTGAALMDGARPDYVHGLGSPGPGSSFELDPSWGVKMTDTMNPGDPVTKAPFHGPTPPNGSIPLQPMGEGHFEYFDPIAIVDMIFGRRERSQE